MTNNTELSTWLEAWRHDIHDELTNNILAYWTNHTIDHVNGGFVGAINDANEIVPGADKSLVLNTRILWTFSTAYRLLKDESHLRIADRAYDYIVEHFVDAEHGGLYWMADALGAPAQTQKIVYGQAFSVYAFSEYYRAAGKQEALDHAIRLYELLESHSYDKENGGYFESHTRDWLPNSISELSSNTLRESKSMNTHLHVLEAYTNLYRAWPSEKLRQSQSELLAKTLQHIVDQESGHFKLFFDERWNSLSGHISYGHDIEGSWLIAEAAEVLGEPELAAIANASAIRMAEAVLLEGVDADGGILNEADASGIIDSNKDWWPQAEAVVGFFNAYELTGDSRYLDAARASWGFTDRFIIDHKDGEWHWSVTREGVPTTGKGKVNAWKCPYHNSRACFEMLERIERTLAHSAAVHE
ncbi:cellobiose 2-epimerase [Paenibacillus sp. CCS19]|uniref:AGE family epimerase/isomerase n=1 Tax=Paenibacillus sp. CCS19 TaxID=3158387 RepID=UPI002564BD2C|nr:AGE family epimerase/isomerase [Paenibacillus cellulosilyticus]GMK38033.1 cellobiose 2-epimerase [Paenibacillus cellulosilyticus]